jgi:hypothetical protein
MQNQSAIRPEFKSRNNLASSAQHDQSSSHKKVEPPLERHQPAGPIIGTKNTFDSDRKKFLFLINNTVLGVMIQIESCFMRLLENKKPQTKIRSAKPP